MLVTPIQERMDDWKKAAVQLDKEHGKGIYADTQYYLTFTLTASQQPFWPV